MTYSLQPAPFTPSPAGFAPGVYYWSHGDRTVAVRPHQSRLPHYTPGVGRRLTGGLTGMGPGLGTMTTTQSAIAAGSQAGQIAATGSTDQLVLSAPSLVGGVATSAVAGASWSAIAIPIIGAAVVGVTIFLATMFRRGRQKEAATQIVNEIEPQLITNRDGYLSGPRTRSSQAQALANFDAAWQAVIQACSNPQLGSAGQRCISDRDRSACVWKENGQCWNWWVGYRDPIANDLQVRPDPVQTATGSWIDPATGEVLQQSALDSLTGGQGGLLLIGAGLGAAYLLMGDRGRGGRY